MFGNAGNLINKSIPFGKYPGPIDGSDQKILASYWYCKTYDNQISDTQTEFLLPIEVYMDKTGKTTGLQLYCGDPMTWFNPPSQSKCLSIRQGMKGNGLHSRSQGVIVHKEKEGKWSKQDKGTISLKLPLGARFGAFQSN
jgi:hypothetical protein